MEDPEQHGRVGAPACDRVDTQPEPEPQTPQDRVAHRSHGGHPLRHQAGQRCRVLRVQVGAVQRPPGPDPGVVLVEVDPEVEALLGIRDASGQLAADGEPPPPRPTGECHRDGRLGLIG